MGEIAKVAESLAYVTHLRREGPLAEALYAKLAARNNDQVHVSEVEEELGCKWGEVDIVVGDGMTQRMDPYFWKLVENVMRDSVHGYVMKLETLLSGLTGCEVGQLGPATEGAMDGVRRATAHHLTNALLDRRTTVASLVQLLTRLRDGWLVQHVDMAKARMRDSIRRVRALARVVAVSDDQLEETLQMEEAELQGLFAEFPVELQDQLQQRNISILEIGPVFAPQHNGFVQSSTNVPPPSFAVRASVLSRWLARCSDAVSEACVSVLAMMRRTADLPPLSPEWSGVQLAMNSPTDPRTRGCNADRVAQWPPPAHLGPNGESRVVVVDANQQYTGLRVGRLFAVLLDQARLGLLPAVTIRANLLVPIVARFASEGEIGYGQYVDMRLRPVAARCDLPWPEDRGQCGKRRMAPSPVPSEEQRVVQQPRLPMAAAPVAPVMPVQSQVAHAGTVPPKLLRDHSILHGLALCLQSRHGASSVRVALDEVVTAVRGVSPALQVQSDASLRQAVRWVCVEVIKRAHAQVATTGNAKLTMEFSSERDRTSNGRVGGVVCEDAGVGYLYQYVTWCVNQMRFNGPAFCSVWHASRSAQSKAGALAHKIAGHKPGGV